jgi:dihydroorotase
MTMTNTLPLFATPTLIHGARVLLPSPNPQSARLVRTDVCLSDGRIVGVGSAPSDFDRSSARCVDASGLVLAPGLVDLCARHGNEASAVLEASAGGITYFIRPEVVRVGDATDTTHRAADDARDFFRGFDSCHDRARLRAAMLRAQAAGVALFVQPQDRTLAGTGVMASGNFAVRLGLPGVPVSAETQAIQTVIALIRETGATVHLSRLSSVEGVALVRAAKASGLPLHCDVSIHHLHLSDVDIGWFDSRFRFDPPLRGTVDRDALRSGLADGTIDAICSDHTPHRARVKQVPFAQAPAGAPAFALLLALTVKWASEERVPLAEALSRITSMPAAIVGSRAGRIAVGAVADLVLFDPDDYWQVRDGNDAGIGTSDRRAISPFAGFELPAPIRETWLAGHAMSAFWTPSDYTDCIQDR